MEESGREGPFVVVVMVKLTHHAGARSTCRTERQATSIKEGVTR